MACLGSAHSAPRRRLIEVSAVVGVGDRFRREAGFWPASVRASATCQS
jgi:hypothetical protein